jgi:hypothetical protein
MARVHLVAAEIGSDTPCRFRFQIEQSDGRAASLAFDVPFSAAPGGAPDIGKIFATARADLVGTLLGALIAANRLDAALAPRQEQPVPNRSLTLDLRAAAAANDDHHMRAIRAGGTS